ncbi:class I SAM-dependent methyltransferase [Streptomyces rochei]|uniref:class I SAM-dependent methyltransferase n=1 Tax=Streptomyces rochei TaxID=1928 RepID=UPI0033AAE25A
MGRVRVIFDRIHRRLFALLSLLPVEQQGKLLRLSFESKHKRPDPWGHAVFSYETYKYGKTLNCVPVRHYRRIADIGCSEGVFTCRVAGNYRAADVVGLDISRRALGRARQRARQEHLDVTFRACDILNQSFEGKFDLVFCSELLYYLGSYSRLRLASERIVDLLEPGGLLLLTHPWPESRRLHLPFDTHPGVLRFAEYIDQSTHHPFAVTVYERL